MKTVGDEKPFLGLTSLLSRCFGICIACLELMDSRFDALRVCNRNDCDDYEVDDDEAINGEFVVFLFVFTQALLSDEVFVSLFVQFPITTITAEV